VSGSKLTYVKAIKWLSHAQSAEMRPIVAGVPQSVSFSVCVCPLDMTMSCARISEPIKMPLGCELGHKGPCIRQGHRSPRERGNFGVSPSPLSSIGNIRHEAELFSRWQRRCGLSLSVLQQLVIVVDDVIMVLRHRTHCDVASSILWWQFLMQLQHGNRITR